MQKYPKIETIFARDLEGSKKLMEGVFRDPTVEYLAPCEWIWTEKVDGCLRRDTKLLQTNGETITIGEVVEKKLPVEIYGFNGTDIVPTKVIAWHKNGITDDWYGVTFNRRGLGTKGGNSFGRVWCTGNHKFYVNGDYKRADELQVGEKVTIMRSTQSLTYMQKQILIGLYIGDGCLANENRSVEFSHKADHVEYLNWILDSLGGLGGNTQERISGYGSEIVAGRTVSCIQTKEFFNDFIKDGKKIIPKNIQLSPISLAVMYLDDGSLIKSEGQKAKCILCLNNFDEESVDNLVEAMNMQLHLYPVKYDSKGWNLRFNLEDSEILQTIIAPYVCNCMSYKLDAEYQGRFQGVLPEYCTSTINTPMEMEILEIVREHKNHWRYDLTTETHNYFANNVLVHNCNIRVYWDGYKVTFGGRTDNASIPAELVTKLNEYFGGEVNAQVFEQMFGEREVILFGEGYGRKIQKDGGNYIPDGVDFILFDVLVGNLYLDRANVEDIARKLGVKVVPIVGSGSLYDAVEYVKVDKLSQIAAQPHRMEGIVCRPKMEMQDRRGNRLIVKIKYEDMKELV